MQTQEIAHPDSLVFTSKPRYRKIGMRFDMILSRKILCCFNQSQVMDLHPLFLLPHSVPWPFPALGCQAVVVASWSVPGSVGRFTGSGGWIQPWWFHDHFWWFHGDFMVISGDLWWCSFVIKGFGHHLKCIERYTHRSTCRMYRCTNMIATKTTSKCKENDPTSDWELYLDPNNN